MLKSNNRTGFLLLLLLFFLLNSKSEANNLYISDFSLYTTDVPGIILTIDTLGWDNSWRSDIQGPGYSAPHNHDAVWLFAKYRKKNTQTWYPAKFTSLGQTSFAFQFEFPDDSMGVFVYRSQNGSGNVAGERLMFLLFPSTDLNYFQDTIDFRLFGIEMVYIPQGSFFAGDGTTANITGQFTSSNGNSPFEITGEAQITLGGLGANSLNNHNATGMNVADDFNNTVTQILPAQYPKGFNSFYCMKYEVTAGQYVDFLNCLDTAQSQLRFANTFGTERNSIQKLGSKYFTNAPDRANNFMSWADGAAYADWVGLRPMTELELEKISRGPLAPVADEFAWGSTAIFQLTSFNGIDGSGTETALPLNANCNYNLIDGGMNHPVGGPCRVGIFATSVSDRVSSGATYYGVMDMTGNVWERTISVGNPDGRVFDGRHGNGLVDSFANADVVNWPGTDAQGTTFRMGNWFRATERARISDRFFGATAFDNRTGHRGFRCIRTSN